MTRPLVWLPFPPDWPVPGGVQCDVVDINGGFPDSAGEVEMVVLPFGPDDEALSALADLPKLRVMQSLAAGVDRVLPFVPPGVTLCSGRGMHDTATAELAIALVLSASRGLGVFAADQSARRWEPRMMPGLADKRVLVIGCGSIGSAIAARLRCLECDVVPVGRSRRDGVHGASDLPDLLPGADVVILAVPLTPETTGLVDREFLDRMRPGALLVNVARGAVVVTDDLIDALHAGRVSAAVDVTDPEPLPGDSPLWTAPNLILTPHVGARTDALPSRVQRILAAQVARFAAGEPLENIVT